MNQHPIDINTYRNEEGKLGYQATINILKGGETQLMLSASGTSPIEAMVQLLRLVADQIKFKD